MSSFVTFYVLPETKRAEFAEAQRNQKTVTYKRGFFGTKEDAQQEPAVEGEPRKTRSTRKGKTLQEMDEEQSSMRVLSRQRER